MFTDNCKIPVASRVAQETCPLPSAPVFIPMGNARNDFHVLTQQYSDDDHLPRCFTFHMEDAGGNLQHVSAAAVVSRPAESSCIFRHKKLSPCELELMDVLVCPFFCLRPGCWPGLCVYADNHLSVL